MVWTRMMMRLWNSASVRACHAQAHVLKRRRHHGAPRVLHIRLFCHFELAAAFARALQKLTSNGLETSVTAADPQQRMVYFEPLSGEQAILEVPVVTAGSGASLA